MRKSIRDANRSSKMERESERAAPEAGQSWLERRRSSLTGRDSAIGRLRRRSSLFGVKVNSSSAHVSFRQANASQDGLLKREEFFDALGAIMRMEHETALFDALSADQVDEEFARAAAGNDKDFATAAEFEAWRVDFVVRLRQGDVVAATASQCSAADVPPQPSREPAEPAQIDVVLRSDAVEKNKALPPARSCCTIQ